MWMCPECGRKFSRNQQSHSCLQYNIENLFFGKGDEARSLYEILIIKVAAFGEVEVHIGKWGITVRHLSTFLSVMIEKKHLTLIFISAGPIDEFPVYQTHQHSGSRYNNAVKIESEEEMDDQLMRWLREAWELAV